MNRTFLTLLLSALLFIPVAWVIAADNDEDERGENPRLADVEERQERDEDDEQEEREDDDDEGEDDEFEDEERLGRTVKIEFQIVHEDDSEPPMIVLCATRDYHISRDVAEAESEHHIHIHGVIMETEEENTFLLEYETYMSHSNFEEDIEEEFETAGSVQIGLGQSMTIARHGGADLKVTISVEK